MTRYLCGHPSHGRNGDPRHVDVSAQVRLERDLLPRTNVYLAYTERVIDQVMETPYGPDRVEAITNVLTGTPWTADAPVLLMSERVGVERAAGLYEEDELRRREPAAGRLLHRFGSGNVATPGSEDFVVVDEHHASSFVERGRQALLTRARPRSIPQGVYPVRTLAVRLAEAPIDAAALEDVIRQTPTYGRIRSHEFTAPWRVVITCPKIDGDFGQSHRTIFTGNGEPEPAVVYGTPAVGWDAALEDSAVADLGPSKALERSETRLKVALMIEALVVVALITVTWASGGLALAARETPGWLGFAVALAAGGAVFGSIVLFAPRDPEGNANDTFRLRHFYASRIETLWWAGMVSGALFALAIVCAIVPPVLLRDTPVPAPQITFDASSQPVTATVSLTLRDVGSDDSILVMMRQYADGGRVSLVGRVVATGNASGSTLIRETVALDAGARLLSVHVVLEGRAPTACRPSSSRGPGCTVVSVPPLGAGIVRAMTTEIVVSPAAPPSVVVPSPSPSPSA
jgi:hypothetical protein